VDIESQDQTSTKIRGENRYAMLRLLCKKCGWFLDDAITKSKCQDCKIDLTILKGDKDKIEKRTMELVGDKAYSD
jgi:hypothetical protein